MLEIQKYLQSGKTFDNLEIELGIKATFHSTLPLVIINYNQINSPKIHPIVKECRGLTLERDTWKIIARSFPRFFNFGEEIIPFIWNDKIKVMEKIDGSLMLLYYYQGEWRVNTRGSFAEGNLNFTGKSWAAWFWSTINYPQVVPELDPSFTYVMEFVSPYNKVVRLYPIPQLYLLTVVENLTGRELPIEDTNHLAERLGVLRPCIFSLRDPISIKQFLAEHSQIDPTFEGFVVIDEEWHRFKFKSEMYVNLHHLLNNGNLYSPKRLVPLVLNGEREEILVYFPEIRSAFEAVEEKLQIAWVALKQIWQDNREIVGQKEFALAILGKTPFTGMLFQVRKQDKDSQSVEHLREIWQASADIIVKVLFVI